MNMKALLLLTLTLFTVVSTVATVVIAFNISTPKLFSTIKTIGKSRGLGDIQPTGGDEVDNPVFPD